jgi:ABC-type branched-subunit amino acid transport system ATPase component
MAELYMGKHPNMSILETNDLSRSFGGMTAVDNLSTTVEDGSITGLIGPNGAGKSTAFNLMTGILEPDSGTVRFRDEDITGLPPYSVASRGMGRTFQQARIFDQMTVRENLEVVPYDGDDGDAEINRLLSLIELTDEEESFAGKLSGGQQVLVGIARVLMLQPDLVLFDEPFSGVNPGLVDDIRQLLERLRTEEGVTILIIDHEIDEISELCDEIIVMAEGRQLTKGTPEEVRTDERVIASYLGGGR